MNSVSLFLNVIEPTLREHPEWEKLNQQEFMGKFFKDKTDKTSKNLGKLYSNWKHLPNKKQIEEIDPKYKKVIKEVLRLEDTIWNLNNEDEQKTQIKNAIKDFLTPSSIADIGPLISQNSPLSNGQKNYLHKIKKLSFSEIEKEMQNKENDFFAKSHENQAFLLMLMDFFYKNGFYELLDRFIVSSLTYSNSDDFEVKMIRAHTLGSLNAPKYLEAMTILKALTEINNDFNKITDLHTSQISNMRRDLFSEINLTIETIKDYIKLLLGEYSSIFEQEKCYYPGINLAYIVALSEIFEVTYSDYNIKEIYESCKDSIKSDKSLGDEEKYYATMSEIEFNLLQYNHQKEEISALLATSPSHDNTIRTKRQMEQFCQLVQEHYKQVPLECFKDTINNLDSYLNPNAKASKDLDTKGSPSRKVVL